MKNIKGLCSMGAMLTLALPAAAHDVWLEPGANGYELVYGHPGELESYDSEKLKKVVGYDGAGKSAEGQADTSGHRAQVQVPAQAGMVTVFFDNGFWTSVPDGYANLPKKWFKSYDKAMHSLKYNKNIFGWSDQYKQPVGLDFELVPLANPLDKNTAQLPVQVLYKGKPVGGVKIEVHGQKTDYTTDAQGQAVVPLSAQGLQYIAASYKVPLQNDANADEMALGANLVLRR